MFSREVSLDIIDAVRDAGARGISAKGIREEYMLAPGRHKYPMSTIYQALSGLEQSEWIKSTTRPILRWGRPPKGETERIGRDRVRGGKPLKIYTLGRHLTPIDLLDEEFTEDIAQLLKKHVEELKEVWTDTLQRIINEIGTGDLRRLLPQDEIQECGFSHEGYEFLTAISLGILKFIEDEDEWKALARKNKIIK